MPSVMKSQLLVVVLAYSSQGTVSRYRRRKQTSVLMSLNPGHHANMLFCTSRRYRSAGATSSVSDD